MPKFLVQFFVNVQLSKLCCIYRVKGHV